MQTTEKFQKQILDAARHMFPDNFIGEAIEKAFLETPRHRFVSRYRLPANKEWQVVNESNLEQHLPFIYRDGSLILFGDDDEEVTSTISQPSFVLYMLDLLKLESGHKVFELGAGSGWNAALIGHIVGSEGAVYSLEIIPEMADAASKAIASLGRANVHIIQGDGGAGYEPGAPYDRAIFTAGSYDIPRHFYEQIKDDGLFLIVIKNEGGGDSLFLLRKKEDHFESTYSLPCGFVRMTGQYSIEGLDPISLEDIPEWAELKDKEISRIPFWWGGKGHGFVWRTLSVRSFLSITEPLYRSFKAGKTNKPHPEENFFGLWDKEHNSLAIAKNDLIIAYGNSSAKDRLMERIRYWVDLGMPASVSFRLQVYPADRQLTASENQWIVKRRESQFLWSLDFETN